MKVRGSLLIYLLIICITGSKGLLITKVVKNIIDSFGDPDDQNFIAIDWSAFSRFALGVAYFSNVTK